MSTLSSVSGSGGAWAAAQASHRSQMQAKMFAKADTDGNGSVDASELSTVLSDVSQKTGVKLDGNADQLHAKMDTNQDGSLSSEELGKGVHALMPPPSTVDFAQARGGAGPQAQEGQGDDLFAKLDANGDGSLDTTELQALADKVKADTGQDISDKLSKLDTDGDGKLSKAEFDAGRPDGTAQAANGAAPPEAAGKAHGAGGGAPAATSDDDTVYDPLDTNKDGVVSEMERLVGDLDNAAKGIGQSDTANQDVAALAKDLYEEVAGGWPQPEPDKTLSATA